MMAIQTVMKIISHISSSEKKVLKYRSRQIQKSLPLSYMKINSDIFSHKTTVMNLCKRRHKINPKISGFCTLQLKE